MVVTLIAVYALVTALVASAGTVIKIAPTGVVHTATPDIVAHFTGTAIATWGGTAYTNPEDITIKLDGEYLAYTRVPVASSFDVTVTAPVTRPLTEGLHSVIASSTTGVQAWTFEYVADVAAPVAAITDVWPLGDTSDYTWDNTARFAVTDGSISPTGAVAAIVVDGTSYPATYQAPYYRTAALTLGMGPHDATGTVTASGGATATRHWTFVVNQKPVVDAVTPASGSRSLSTTTTVTAHVTDVGGGVVSSGVVLRVNGTVVPATFAADGGGGGSVSYTPSTPFPSDTTVTVTLEAKDIWGAVTTKTWSFEVTHFTQMSSGAAMPTSVCKSCHGSDFNAIHIDQTRFTHYDGGSSPVVADGYANCITCHQTLDTAVNDPGQFRTHDFTESDFTRMNDPTQFCAICHRNMLYPEPYSATWNYLAHGKSSFVWTGLPAGAAVTAPREAMDCVYCHQKGSAAPEQYGPHDTLSDHEIGVDAECMECHSDVLTREHAAAGRTDASGAAITCSTCHESADATVRDASGKKWIAGTDRWVAASSYTYAGPSPRVMGPWSYMRDGVAVPVNRIKVHIKGSAAVVVAAYYGGAWHDILTVANWDVSYPPMTQLVGGLVLNQDSTRDITVPGATAFKVTITSYGNGSNVDGARVGITVMDTNPARPAVTCHTCHGESDHVSVHATTLEVRCASCHQQNLVTEHVDGRGLSCGTCHNSADAAVLSAIQDGDTSCDACHADADHLSLHDSTLPRPSCVSSDCHAANLITEHVTKRGLECAVCHGSDFASAAVTSGAAVAAESAVTATSVMDPATGTAPEGMAIVGVSDADLAEAMTLGSTNCDACHEPNPHGNRDDCGTCHGPLPSTTDGSEPSTVPVTWDPTGDNAAIPTPHKGYTTSTQKCSACHTVHMAPASGELLLRSAAASACEYCHVLTDLGGIVIYGGSADVYYGVGDPTAHNRTSYSACTSCHSTHGANTLDGANTVKILRDWARDDSGPTYTAEVLAAWPDPANLVNDDAQITAWCTGCHKYYIGDYQQTQQMQYFDHDTIYDWVPVTGMTHIMTSTIDAYANPAAGSSVLGQQVAFASSAYCTSCHDAGVRDAGPGVVEESFPHSTPNYYRFMTTAESVAGASHESTSGPYDGLCLKCHRKDDATGVGLNY